MIRVNRERLTAVLAAASIWGVIAMPADAQPKYNEVKPTSDRPWVSAHETPYRSDEVVINLPGDGKRGGELEWKVRMKAGATMIYSWAETGTPADEFYSDLHGHATVASPNGEFDLANYHKGTGDKHAGALVAAVDGVHGWYLKNDGEKDSVVTIKLAGFYELIPPGQVGNESGIKAKGQD